MLVQGLVQGFDAARRSGAERETHAVALGQTIHANVIGHGRRTSAEPRFAPPEELGLESLAFEGEIYMLLLYATERAIRRQANSAGIQEAFWTAHRKQQQEDTLYLIFTSKTDARRMLYDYAISRNKVNPARGIGPAFAQANGFPQDMRLAAIGQTVFDGCLKAVRGALRQSR